MIVQAVSRFSAGFWDATAVKKDMSNMLHNFVQFWAAHWLRECCGNTHDSTFKAAQFFFAYIMYCIYNINR